MRRFGVVRAVWQAALLASLSTFGLAGLGGLAEAASAFADGTVRFEVGSSNLTAESEKVLDRLAGILKRRPDLDPIELVGHTDNRGAAGTNRALSLGRAKAVRRALVLRGIRPSRILTRGVGSATPLSTEDTDEARSLNRRVEVWITPQRPVAEVTRVQKTVLSREAAAPRWQDARVGQSLRRLARVRTERSSASEVTFRSQDRVQLGPEALVVIYDTPREQRGPKTAVADVAVEQGTIFAAMAAQDRALEVQTQAARVSVRSKRTRVDVRRRAKARAKAKAAREAKERMDSTVSVFDGRSDVSAQGKSVAVKKGFGTRVKEGEAPEPPQPLPLAPQWTTRDPYVRMEGQPLDLQWKLPPGVSLTEIQLGGADDPDVERPRRMWQVEGSGTRGGFAETGLYHLRLVGVDGRGISGAPGKTLRLLVLPRALDADGRPSAIGSERIRMKKPGALTVPAPPFASLTMSSTTSTVGVQTNLLRPGAHKLPFTLSAPGIEATGVIEIWVDTATLTATFGVPGAAKGRSRTEVTLSVATADGPVDHLQLVAGVVPKVTPRLLAGPGHRAPLVDCLCQAPPGAIEVEGQGAGVYRFTVDRPTQAGTSSVSVRVFEPQGRLAAEIWVPVASESAAGASGAQKTRKAGFFGGVRVGALVSHSDAPTAELSGELGYRLALGRGLELDLSAEAGWLSRKILDTRVHAIPIFARVALGLDLGAPRVYAGAGAGVRILDPGPETGGIATGFVGAGYRFGHSEFIVEGAYRYVGRALGADEELAGLSVIVGYRLGTFFVGD